jgi:SulP family sulfate permease
VAAEPEDRGTWANYVPIVTWLRAYDRAWLRPDLLAGLTLWAILVPQALAYGQLAGVPAVFGLYAALGAMVLYAVFGTTRELNVGPESTVAIVSASVVAPLAGQDAEKYLALMALLALMIGGALFLGGLARLGAITRLLSLPVLMGYITGSAFVIVGSQLQALLGLEIESSLYFLEIGAVLRNLGQTDPATLALGLATLALIYGIRALSKSAPVYLIALITATLATVLLGLQEYGVSVMGEIDSGLPSPGLPEVTLSDVGALALPALAIGLLVFADSVLTSQSLAKINDYEIDSNQEFFGLAAANVGSGFLGGFPVNGSQSRSIVAADAGEKTQVSGFVATILVVITLLWLTPFFEMVPDAGLAAIVIVAGIGLLDIPELRRLYRLQKPDFWLAIIGAAAVLLFGMLAGIVIAIILSLLDVARRAAQPHTAVLVREPGTDRFRDADVVEGGQAVPGLLVYRFDGPIFFANVHVLRDEVRSLVRDAEPPLRQILFDMESVYDIDLSAVDVLIDMREELEAAGVKVTFARVRTRVAELMEESGVVERLGPGSFFLEVDDGVEAFLAEQGEAD